MEMEKITEVTSGVWVMFARANRTPQAFVFKYVSTKGKATDELVGIIDLPVGLNLASSDEEKKKFLKDRGAKKIEVIGENFLIMQ